MNAIQEKIKQNKVVLAIVIGTVALVVIISILMGKNVANAPENGENQSASAALGLGDTTGSIAGDELSISNQAPAVTVIRYPVLSNPDLFDYSGEISECKDEIVWITTSIAPTKAILNATLREMFQNQRDLGFTPGNFVANQSGVEFDRAVIENGVAKIYLSGAFAFNKKDKCDPSRPIIQITEAARQFDTVKSVEIYLEGKRL